MTVEPSTGRIDVEGHGAFAGSVRLGAKRMWRRWLAHAFRVTGRRAFISAYCRGRNLLLSVDEIYAIGSRMRLRPGNLLVFGAGNDSIFWATLNHGQATVFLESDSGWLSLVRAQDKNLILYPVTYTSRLLEIQETAAHELPETPPLLVLPGSVREQHWTTVLVDAPQGWGDGPGRLQSIFEAGRLVAPGGTIFVHDCDREGEQRLVGRYLRPFQCLKLTSRLWSFS